MQLKVSRQEGDEQGAGSSLRLLPLLKAGSMQTLDDGSTAFGHALGTKCTHTQLEQLAGLLCLDHAQAGCMTIIAPPTHRGCQVNKQSLPTCKAGG